MKISIVIPTLNEEKHISSVIEQFAILDPTTYEILIGDGGSTDRTIAIAREKGARVIIDELQNKTIASGRNAAAAYATGDILMFCDADTRLGNIDTLYEIVTSLFHDESIVAAIPKMEVFENDRLLRDEVFHTSFNALIRLSYRMGNPISRGQCQIIRRSAFHKVGGYNNQQIHGEDTTIFHKLSKIGKLKFIENITIYESPRRYRKYGYLQIAFLGIYSTIGQSILNRNILKRWDRVD